MLYLNILHKKSNRILLGYTLLLKYSTKGWGFMHEWGLWRKAQKYKKKANDEIAEKELSIMRNAID